MLKKLVISAFLLVGAAFVVGGCATILKGGKAKMTYNSEPSDAKVYMNGQLIGTTPFQLEVRSNQSYNFEFRKDGYETRSVMVNNYVGAGWIILDVLLGLVPVIVDAATGDWNYLDQTNLNASLAAQR